MPSAFTHGKELWASILKEVQLGRIIGPFSQQPLDPLICSPVGMVPKKHTSAMRCITHLSHPLGKSVNSYIAPEDAETHYQSFQDALQLVASQGKGSFMAKEDIKSAFRNIPMQFSDLNLLGICVQGQYFIDCALPFGASISCAIFEQVATLIHWIVEKHSGHKMVHYLDDFFIVHRYASVCCNIMCTFKDICQQIAMPIALDKAEGPTTVIEFLGLTIDSNLMVVRVPQDKLHDISAILTKMIRSRKATSWELQSLAGKLNFITKAVPAGRSFMNRIYQAFRGIPNHWHIDLQSTVLSDLWMWKVFLQRF